MIKKVILALVSIVLFLGISYLYVPEVLSDQIVNQSDIRAYKGMAQEAQSWDKTHPDDKAAWTNSMFSGMPTIMITGNSVGDYTLIPYHLLQSGKRPASYLFISLLGAFLLMLSLGISYIPAIIGAIAITFCSYNMQIIQVGHNTKMLALAFLPWVLAACIYCYKSALGKFSESHILKKWGFLPKTLFAGVLFAFACSFELKANHIQISYYLAIIMILYVLSLFIYLLIRQRENLYKFFTASVILLVMGIIGIACNANHLIPSYEYSKETMRGGSDLEQNHKGEKRDGLSLDYATAWSYGWQELPNLMIPDFNGGSSNGELSMESHTIKLLRSYGQENLSELAKSMPLYWGPQPFTAGPMYMGAISIFLFLLGLFLCRTKEKWWLLIATLIAIGLALGSHMMFFTKIWYYYAPFYNKFRTVSMALVILQFTLPLLGFLCLDRILKGKYDMRDFRKYSLISLVLTAGFCVLVYIIPSIAGNFSSSSDSSLPQVLISSLKEDRIYLLKTDAMKSLISIVICFAVLWGSYRHERHEDEHWFKDRRKLGASIVIGAIVFLNLGIIGKRYLNADHFVPASEFNAPEPLTAADQAILKDKDPDYRVLNLNRNVFNDAQTSYYHKSIGGYSPVKLQRYQDLIDHNLSSEIRSIMLNARAKGSSYFEAGDFDTPVLNMLNDKYIIVGDSYYRNKNAFGNAWFIDSYVHANSPIQELDLLDSVNLRKQAIVGKDFQNAIAKYDNSETQNLSTSQTKDSISLSYYSPNTLKYKYFLSKPKTAVFSEIYYPKGWTAKLDNGKDLNIYRVDWILRAINLPAGGHELTVHFAPPSYQKGDNISRASSILLYVLLLLIACPYIYSTCKRGYEKKES